MRVVNVTNLESGAVSGQTARTQCGETALMRQLSERVVLIHELRQRRRSEELLDCRGNRADIDECLRGELLLIVCLNAHALTDDALHSGKADAELILKQLTDAADTAVAEVVDVISRADAVAEIAEVADGCKDVISGDVLRNELVFVDAEQSAECIRIAVRLIEQDSQLTGRDLLIDAVVSGVEIGDDELCIGQNIDHAVAEDLDLALLVDELGLIGLLILLILMDFRHDERFRHARLLNLLCQLRRDLLARNRELLTGHGAEHILSELLVNETGSDAELLVILVSAETAEIIASGIEEQVIDQRSGCINRSRIARTQLLVNLKKCLVDVLLLGCRIAVVLFLFLLLDGRAEAVVITEEVEDLVIQTDAERADECGNRDLAVLINLDVDDVIGIHFIFEPCAAVRDDCGIEQHLAGLIAGEAVVDARRTDELGDNDTLRAVDDERTGVGHEGHIAHIDFLLLDLTGLDVAELHAHAQRGGVCGIALLALCNGVLGLVGDLEIEE